MAHSKHRFSFVHRLSLADSQNCLLLLPSVRADGATSSFNPKPEAMAGSGIDRPRAAPAIASGFGLNDELVWRACAVFNL